MLLSYGSRHAKKCLRAYAHSEGPDQPAGPDQALLYPPTESLVTIDVSMVSKCPDGTLYMSGMNLNLHLAHGW